MVNSENEQTLWCPRIRKVWSFDHALLSPSSWVHAHVDQNMSKNSLLFTPVRLMFIPALHRQNRQKSQVLAQPLDLKSTVVGWPSVVGASPLLFRCLLLHYGTNPQVLHGQEASTAPARHNRRGKKAPMVRVWGILGKVRFCRGLGSNHGDSVVWGWAKTVKTYHFVSDPRMAVWISTSYLNLSLSFEAFVVLIERYRLWNETRGRNSHFPKEGHFAKPSVNFQLVLSHLGVM